MLMHLRTGSFTTINPSYNPQGIYPSVMDALPRTTLICKIKKTVLRVTQVVAHNRGRENTLLKPSLPPLPLL